MSLRKGSTVTSAFDTYIVQGQIGEGGFSEVFEASDEGGERFALKLLKANLPTSKRKRLKNELRFLEQVRHKNIVRVLDHGEHEVQNKRRAFLVMPLFPKTFRQALVDVKNADAKMQLYFQLLDGVEAAHLSRVWHRDLKPENILWNPSSGELVVSDFGIAHFSEDNLATWVETQASDRLANFLYAAPEQKTRSAAVDGRADIFALGMLLVEFFTGTLPLGEGYPQISSRAPGHSYLDDIGARMIRNDPRERYSSIDDIKQEIAAASRTQVARQLLDEVSKVVINRRATQELVPVAVVDWDWDNNSLVAILNQPPPGDWINVLRNESFRHTAFMGQGPGTASVTGNRLKVRADEDQVSQQQGHVQEWLQQANHATIVARTAEAAQRQREEEDVQRRKQEDAAKRVRVLSRLKRG